MKIMPFCSVFSGLSNGTKMDTRNVVLALGHSARDSFEMLERIGVILEQKPFAVGLRIEHPQNLIDSARWGKMAGHPQLGHAEYKLVCSLSIFSLARPKEDSFRASLIICLISFIIFTLQSCFVYAHRA